MLEGLQISLGVELHVISDTSYSCRYCLLSKKGNALTIEDTKVITGTLGDILQALPKKHPIALCLTGKGIIHKNIKATTESDPIVIFNTAFPAIDQNEFYVQQYGQGENFLVSLTRKQQLDELIDKLLKAGLQIYMLTLGGIVVVQILEQLNTYGQRFEFDGQLLHLNSDGTFIDYKIDAAVSSGFPIKIAQENIAEENLVAYAMAFQLILFQKLSPIVADVAIVNSSFIDYTEREQIKKKGFIFLLLLLGILLVNFLLFSYYNDENAKLVQKVGAQTATADQTDLLKKNIAENEALLKKLSWNGGYNYGYLLNEIGAGTPKQLQLQEISFNDFKTELDRMPLIKISGTTNNLTAVNNWIFVLKEKSWIKTVKLLKYQEDEETGQYQFNLAITY